jgi:hypothetical protein
MHILRNKGVLLAGIVLVLLAMLAIATRSTLQDAGADTGKAIQNRNTQLKEAFKAAEGH